MKKLKDVFYYFQGYSRYYFYYHPILHKLIRKHIKEQIDFRIKIMDPQCYHLGQCKICGCATTALQMANKSCDKPCYPPMMTKKEWTKYKLNENI